MNQHPPAADAPGSPQASPDRHAGERLPILIALVLLITGGVFLLDRADAQARDTIRKHHLEDIEQALYFARGLQGTYPPYDQPSWCGRLADPKNEKVRAQIEEALRAQNDKYANPDKPFPTDPSNPTGYFYWKRSPAIFELYSTLETDPNAERNTIECSNGTAHAFDYGLTSVWREGH